MMRAAWLFPVLLMVACRPAAQRDRTQAWHAVPVTHAKAFAIMESDQGHLLMALDVDGGDTMARYTTELQESTGIPLPRPASRIAVGSTTHMPYLNMLGAQDRVVAVAFPQHQFDEELARRVQAGEVSAISSLEGPGREVIIARGADLLLGYPFGNGGDGLEGGPPTVLIAEYSEPHPLGRAEWLRFFGVLLGREALADSLFEGIDQRYMALRSLAADPRQRPTVFFGSAWMGQWHVPGGRSHIARLIADAGGHYLFGDLPGTGNIALGMEQVVQVALDAEHWGMVLRKDGAVGREDMTGGDARLAHIGQRDGSGLFVANSAESDIFGQALLEPDVLLADLIHLFHPHLLPEHAPVYFKRVAQ